MNIDADMNIDICIYRSYMNIDTDMNIDIDIQIQSNPYMNRIQI